MKSRPIGNNVDAADFSVGTIVIARLMQLYVVRSCAIIIYKNRIIQFYLPAIRGIRREYPRWRSMVKIYPSCYFVSIQVFVRLPSFLSSLSKVFFFFFFVHLECKFVRFSISERTILRSNAIQFTSIEEKISKKVISRRFSSPTQKFDG